jgi:hypothetical protein
MLDTIDCAVLMVPAHDSWMRGWIDTDASQMRRFTFHSYPFADSASPCATVDGSQFRHETGALALQHAASNLRRFDLCVLPVTLGTLGWSRTALACVQGNLATPILGLLVDIKAPAVSDLLALGMQDFLRFPACLEEFRVRATQLIERRSNLDRGSRSIPPEAMSLAPNRRQLGVYEGHVQYGCARASRSRPEAAVIERAVLELDAAPQLHAAEAFRSAKSRVVSSFEQDYLRLALQRHHGNVARAARASCKHRRAFWALMRKHGIDASVYRRGGAYDA